MSVIGDSGDGFMRIENTRAPPTDGKYQKNKYAPIAFNAHFGYKQCTEDPLWAERA